MADIYIVYAREDEAVAEKLHSLLSHQWETWWDYFIAGEVQDIIEAEIVKAKCVIPIFSSHSRKKPTVISELNKARSLGIKIIPVNIDNCEPPYSYDTLGIVNFHSWEGEIDHPKFKQLQCLIESVVPPRTPPKRPKAIAGGKLPLPTVFMSVSSHETQLGPNQALQALRVFGTPSILISAYDLVPRRKPQAIIEAMNKFQEENKGFILIDSQQCPVKDLHVRAARLSLSYQSDSRLRRR